HSRLILQDTQNTMEDIDTEFLNFDDNEVEEEDEEDNGLPNTEEQPRIQENSGWSSRTRSVAKYLQTIFDKELDNGEVRIVIPVDNLLSDITRKEASRMFFETLVRLLNYLLMAGYICKNCKARQDLLIHRLFVLRVFRKISRQVCKFKYANGGKKTMTDETL
ncbi:hypothetical protein MKX03_029072, partial [Papaver bracteatum]